jgi:hypothetical protein
MRTEQFIASQYDDMARDMDMLVSLGINEAVIAETHPTPNEVKDMVKGLLYVRELYSRFYTHNGSAR